MELDKHVSGASYSSLPEDGAQAVRQQKLDRQRALMEQKKKQKRMCTGMVVANTNVTRPLSSRGLKSSSRPSSSLATLTGSSLQSSVTTADGDISIDSIVTKPLTSSRLSCDANSDINVANQTNENHPLLNDSRITANSDDLLKSEVTSDKKSTTEKRLEELGIAASIDYRDDQQSLCLMNSDDENDENAAVAPISFTPTSSPEQLSDLWQQKSDSSDQVNKGKENQPNEAITKSEQPLPNVGDLEIFALKPVVQNTVLQCRITRDKRGLDHGMYPIYHLHLEHSSGQKIFLMAARLRKKSKSANYVISVDPLELKRNSPCFIGKLRANFVGTSFTVYDNGVNPNKGEALPGGSNCRQELAAVIYETNVFGFKGPRKMSVIIPAMTPEFERYVIRPTKESESLLERYKVNKMDDLLILVNKQPQWSDDSQAYVLNFHGRVTQASVKNFQLVHSANLDYIVLQFGRISEDTFTMDVQFPLCPLQAFAICLSSLDSKLACE